MSSSDTASLKAQLWRAGKLRWKLHASQKLAYDEYRAWEAHALAERKAGRALPGLFPRIFQFDVSRRWGKDFLNLLIRIEDAIRRPGAHYSYGTAYARDIAGIVVPLFHQITEDCPLDIKPEFKQSFQGTEAGLHFPNGSIIKLVGIDRNADGLRGRYSDGITISEAGFVDRLEYCILSVLMPQLQGRQHATIVVNSTPPELPGTWYDETLTHDCRDHKRYVKRTILDNPLLSAAEKDEFIAAAGGLESDRCRREYFVERIKNENTVVFPEFSEALHVKSSPLPRFAIGVTVLDPGVRDLCGVITGYLDFERAKLVVKRSWAKRNSPTTEVAAAIRELESDVFGPNSEKLKYWNGRAVVANPFQRYSDCEARLILDLSTIHKLKVAPADKQDREAALNATRVAIGAGKIEIDPAAKELIQHVSYATWNKSRTSYERSDNYGHYDLADCLVYAWRMASPAFRMNPTPPAAYLYTGDHQNMLWRDSDWRHPGGIMSKLNKILPKRRKSHTG